MESGFHLTVSSKKKASSLSLLLTFFIIAALLLAACGGTNNNQNKTRILRIASHIGADFTKIFSPFEPTTQGVDGTTGMVYETLYYFNLFNGQESPVLAQKYTWNADNTEVTFQLRSNVQWSDGQPFTADDVVFTFDLMKQYPAADLHGVLSYLSSVEKGSDNLTVVAKLKSPNPPSLWYIAGQTFIVPKHTFEGKGDPTKFINDNPVGTGPFTLKSFSPTLVKYQKNPKFWGADQVQVDELWYPSIKDNNVVQEKLLKGEVDWGGFFAPDLDNTYVKKDPAHNHYWMSPVAYTMVYVNLTKAPFNDVAVRHAISAAIDREQIAKQAVSGYVTPASPTGLTVGNMDKAKPEYKDLKFTLDPAQAKKYLDDAGYQKGADGIYLDKNGKKMSYNILVPSGWTDWEQACQIISQSLKAIGIEVKPTSIDQNAYYAARNTGDYDMLMGSIPTPGPTPFFNYDSVLNGTKTAPIGTATTNNWERWQDPKTDQLLQQLGSTTDPAVQKQAIDGLQTIMVEQQPVILLLNHPAWYVFSTKNFTGFPDKDNPYAVGATYQRPDNEQVILHLKPAS